MNDSEPSFFQFTDFGNNPDEKVFVNAWERLQPTVSQRYGLHRHDFYQLFWIASGTRNFTLDFDRFPIEASSLVFVAPGSIHYWDQPQSIKGYSLSFLPDFLQSQGHIVDLYAECPPFDPLYSRPVLKLAHLAAEKVDAYFQEMVNEFNAKLDGYQSVIAAFLRSLFAQIRRFLHEQPEVLPTHRYSNQTARFLRKLSGNPFKAIAASEIARQLGVSRSWLNQLVRHETGKNLTEHLQERLFLEAKRLLAHSQMNVSEIAYVLGFRDASYFTRLFRRIEKCSPREFREVFQ